MKRKAAMLLTLAAIMPMLCGCFGTEPNDTAYVCALGIDEGHENNYNITIQFAKPSQISGKSGDEGGESGESIVENIVVEAPDIYAAINLANHLVSKKFSLSHMKVMVFSEDVARAGIKDFTEVIVRSNEMRPDLITTVALGTANEYLENIKPIIDVNPAKYYQLIFENHDSGGIPKMNGMSAMEYLMSGTRDIVMPLSGTAKTEPDNSERSESSEGSKNSENSEKSESSGDSNSSESPENSDSSKNSDNPASSGNSESSDSSGKTEDSGDNTEPPLNPTDTAAPINENGFQYKIRDYEAGEVRFLNEDKSEVLGMAIFSGDKFTAALDANKADIYNILIGDYKHNYTTFRANGEKPVTMDLTQRREPKYEIDIENRKINISLYMEGNLYSLPFNYDKDDEAENFETECADEISIECENFVKQMRDEYHADVIGLGEKAKKCFKDIKSYNEFEWDTKFNEFEIEVQTEFKIRHSGIIYRRDKE